MLSLIATLGGLIVPPAFDFIKKKFLKPGQDSPEATLSTLSTTKGVPSTWVVDLRASIRPLFVIISLIARICGWIFAWHIDQQFILLMDVCISSWFGSRLV